MYEANYIEFGGVHCVALYSVGNAIANVPGFAIAALAAGALRAAALAAHACMVFAATRAPAKQMQINLASDHF